MDFVLQPWQLLLVILVDQINRQQQQVIDCLRTGNHMLWEKLSKTPVLLSDSQRRLVVRDRVLGRRALAQVGTLTGTAPQGNGMMGFVWFRATR